MTKIPNIAHLPVDKLSAAHMVSAFHQHPDDTGEYVTVVEIRNDRGDVIARTVLEHEGTRQETADSVLDGSGLVRCGEYLIEPLKHRKRVQALLTVDVSHKVSNFEARRAAAAEPRAGTYG